VGASARKKKALIDTSRHTIIESAHPSPLSASGGFFGSRPFSRANAALVEAGREPVDWALPDIPDDPSAGGARAAETSGQAGGAGVGGVAAGAPSG